MKTSSRVSLEIIGSVILGLLTIAVVCLEIFTSSASRSTLETALFNTLQLIVSLGFSWLLTRIVTRREFHESLQRFAISAYRRIRALDVSLSRMVSELDKMRATYQSDKVHELDVIKTIASNMKDTVTSSIADWTEVIGEELSKQKMLVELEERYSRAVLRDPKLASDDDAKEDDPELSALRQEIERLRAELPMMLNYEAKHISAYETPEVIVKALKSSLSEQGELLLYVEAGRSVRIEDLQALTSGTRLILHPGRAMHSFDFVVYKGSLRDDDPPMHLGEILNPYSGLGLHHIEFNKALLDAIQIYAPFTEEGYKDIDQIPAEFVSLSPHNRNHFIIRVPPDDIN